MMAFADAVGMHLRAVNAQVHFHDGVAGEYPALELVFDSLRFALHTAADGSLKPRTGVLQAYSMPELNTEVRLEDWSTKPGFAGAIGAQLVRLGQVLEDETICGVIMYFANDAELHFVNWGDELLGEPDPPTTSCP